MRRCLKNHRVSGRRSKLAPEARVCELCGPAYEPLPSCINGCRFRALQPAQQRLPTVSSPQMASILVAQRMACLWKWQGKGVSWPALGQRWHTCNNEGSAVATPKRLNQLRQRIFCISLVLQWLVALLTAGSALWAWHGMTSSPYLTPLYGLPLSRLPFTWNPSGPTRCCDSSRPVPPTGCTRAGWSAGWCGAACFISYLVLQLVRFGAFVSRPFWAYTLVYVSAAC